MIEIDGEDIICLKKVALLGGCCGPVKISTQKLGDMLGLSQQTASRRLMHLEKMHLVTRTTESSGQYVLLTKEGEELLRREFSEYAKIFEQSNERYILKGVLVSGVGEGRYYMSIPHYQEKFFEICGFEPYSGTLNVKLNPQSLQIRKRMDALEWSIIPGFKDEHRQFGDAKCIKCKISGIDCAIVAPVRTHHPSEIIEIISGTRLRDKLSIKDGDEVVAEIDIS
ncbi:MAG: DUF120 domain-containing protein [Methanocorpusculum sp.]|nr:DUF120 domain-containing protein [Methanocorpusculum sp.]